MTTVIHARNVSEALIEGLWHLRMQGLKETSRNGDVLVSPGPVVTEYEFPTERVLRLPLRDANPVFHLMEAVWMMAGCRNVRWLLKFNSKFGQFAEEDGTQHGAYGHRWFKAFRMDQIANVIEILKANSNSRQAVVQMWAAELDLGVRANDIPCNTHIYFDARGGQLNMTVCCRSNDIIWGAYGANAVHMSILQEVVAFGVGVPIGVYRQFSNNFHLYTELPVAAALLEHTHYFEDPYSLWTSMPLLSAPEGWTWFQLDAEQYVQSGGARKFRTRFFNEVVVPLGEAYLDRAAGLVYGDRMAALVMGNDWCEAFKEWVARREEKKE
jgi:hypothetical protein